MQGGGAVSPWGSVMSWQSSWEKSGSTGDLRAVQGQHLPLNFRDSPPQYAPPSRCPYPQDVPPPRTPFPQISPPPRFNTCPLTMSWGTEYQRVYAYLP